MEAGTLNCPECGAAVSKDSTQCQYCRALLQTVACPQCMGMMFVGSKFCPHCGTKTESLVKGAGASRSCPRCKINLLNVRVADTPLGECTRCGGLWIDISSFNHLCSSADAQQAATALQLPPRISTDIHVRYLGCPECGKLMNRMNYAGCSGIVIEVCRSHGIWLDRDEIRQIIEFIRSGGLQRARQIEKEDLEEARRSAGVYPAELRRPTPMGIGLSKTALNTDDGLHLLRGIASLARHLLSGNDRR